MRKLHIALMTISVALIAGCQSSKLMSEDGLLVDNCQLRSGWAFSNGGEFPGATGKLSVKDGALVLKYDFSKGGNYVAAIRKAILPPAIELFRVNLQATGGPAQLTFRIQDSNGRVFQTKQQSIQGDTTITVPTSGPWHTVWGGKDKKKDLQQPIKSFWILTGNDKEHLAGEIMIKGISVTSSASNEELKPNLSGQPFSVTNKSWSVSGKWQGTWNRPVLVMNARSKGTSPGLLEITFPANGRNRTTRFKLDPDTTSELTYTPPLKEGGNPYNRYLLEAKLSSGRNQAVEVIPLVGKYSDKINFGAPIKSSQVKESSIGTCTHFSFGLSGAFAGWRDYKTLIDLISEAGIKWIREGTRIEKNDDGTLRVRPYDLEWIKYARSKGINIILVIATYAKESPEEYASKCRQVVTETKEYCHVYELGNEPNNFGGWRKTFGGPWNGKEPDNSTSPWVKAHLKVTNAGADAIKKIRPDATVIGLGACTPTNFRYLDLGLSKNVDGVVDHMYTYSMPPERMPFSLRLEKRDGVKVGDEVGSCKGLIDSYVAKFKETGQMRSLWITEFGFPGFWFDGGNEKGLYAGFREEVQAAYTVRRFLQSFTMPIAVSCVYDFIDDYGSKSTEAEANFGIIRADRSPKPTYYAMQRLTSLFNNYKYDPAIKISKIEAPLHRSAKKYTLVDNWDDARITADNQVLVYGYSNPEKQDVKQIAVWSAQPMDGQFNNRSVTFSIDGVEEYDKMPVVINLITGDVYDAEIIKNGSSITVKNLSVDGNPLVIKLIK